MTLGSPTQSPTAANTINHYLPQFLLGGNSNAGLGADHSHLTPSGVSTHPLLNSSALGGPAQGSYNPNSSYFNSPYMNSGINHSLHHPSSLNRELSVPGSGFHQSHLQPGSSIVGSMNHHGLGASGGHHHHSHHHHHHDRALEKLTTGSSSTASGPPISRLADVLNKPSPASNNASLYLQHQTPGDSHRGSLKPPFGATCGDFYVKQELHDLPFTPAGSAGASGPFSNPSRQPPSPPISNDSYTDDADELGNQTATNSSANTWITIFGFPPSAANYVLQEFSVCGQIVRHIISPQGNWMHIQYQTRLQALKALGKNGKVMDNAIMVGVMPCSDKNVMMNSSVNPNNTLGNVSSTQNPCGDTFVSPANMSSVVNSRPGSGLKSALNGLGPSTRLDRSQSLRTGVRPPLGSLNQNEVRILFKLKHQISYLICLILELSNAQKELECHIQSHGVHVRLVRHTQSHLSLGEYLSHKTILRNLITISLCVKILKKIY